VATWIIADARLAASLQLIGEAGGEERLLAAAALVEQAVRAAA
jgi:Asp-tRNA(Asn)/Glu-tRNA(Gln) amidotransferase A subunit family amidase